MWGTATAPGWVPGGEIPPTCVLFSSGAAAGAPVDDSPRPRGPGPSERRGPRRPPSRPSRGRPSACRRLFPSSRLSPAFASTRAARFFAASRSPPPPPLVRGRPPSVSPAKPVGAVCRLPPGRFPVSRPRPERVRDHPALPGVAPRCRVCVGGPPRPHTRPRAPARGRRLGTAAWSVGAVRRAGARPSRGGSAVSGGWPLPVPATRRPPLLSRSSVRVPSCVRCSLPAAVCVGGLRGFPSFPRAAAVRGSRLPPRPRGFFPSSVRSARSLARVSASLDGRPSRRPASSRSYLVDPASSICLSQRLSHACLSTHGRYSETANGSLNQLWFLWSLAPLLLG